jgi:hypothetical protein
LPHPKTGKPTPYDDPLPPPPNHYQSKAHRDAKKESENGQKPAPPRRQSRKSGDSPATNPAIREAQVGLMNQGWKSRQVQGMLVELPAELLETADAETLILEVFKRRAAELAAITKMGEE